MVEENKRILEWLEKFNLLVDESTAELRRITVKPLRLSRRTQEDLKKR
jgi:hypothetical protein